MEVIFDHSEDIAHNIKTFWFKPEKPVNYIAGQFTEIRLPHQNVDDRGDKRWFTISSSPTDELVSITTRFAHNSSSFKQELLTMKPGKPLHLADPMGDFVLPKDKTIPLLFVAGGMGITPMHSMIKFLKDVGEQRDIHLVYALSRLEDLAWRELFESYSLTFTPIVKQAPDNWNGETGSLSSERIISFVTTANSLVYISGPEPMIETFFDELQNRGINKNRLVTDYFPGYDVF